MTEILGVPLKYVACVIFTIIPFSAILFDDSETQAAMAIILGVLSLLIINVFGLWALIIELILMGAILILIYLKRNLINFDFWPRIHFRNIVTNRDRGVQSRQRAKSIPNNPNR